MLQELFPNEFEKSELRVMVEPFLRSGIVKLNMRPSTVVLALMTIINILKVR